PSAVSLPARLTPWALPHSRRISMALSMSPPASVRAALQSIIGALVRSRRAFTAVAEMLLMVSPSREKSRRAGGVSPRRDVFPPGAHAPGSPSQCLLYDRGSRLGVRGADAGGHGRLRPRLDQPLLVGRQGGAALEDGVGQLRQDQLDGA